MTQTFTLSSGKPIKKSVAELKVLHINQQEPSEVVLSNILNFSKNLDVKPSQLVKYVEYMRS